MRAVPRLCEFYPGICLTTEEKARKNLSGSSTLSLSSTLDGIEWSTPRPGRFTPGKDPVPIAQKAGWAPGPVWTGEENIVAPGFDPRP